MCPVPHPKTVHTLAHAPQPAFGQCVALIARKGRSKAGQEIQQAFPHQMFRPMSQKEKKFPALKTSDAIQRHL
jgi:hypothetical protein